jgi:hypothetical protein
LPFAHCDRLTRGQQRVYRKSDDIASVPIPLADALRALVEAVAKALAAEDRARLHELCHHLDYELLRLPDSFHTDGFFRRESSLLRQLVPAAEGEEAS